MDWVCIDESKCTACGLCSKVCLRGCLSEEDGRIRASAGAHNCSLCGHCLAICPSGAITHTQMDMTNLAEFHGQEVVDPDRFMAFVRARRSHRIFKDKEIPREVLERLVEVVRYCPTGGNDQKVEVLILRGRERARELSEISMEFFRQTITENEEALRVAASQGQAPTPAMTFIKYRQVKLKRLLAHWEAGRDPILRGAPLIMIFNCAPNCSTPKDDCVIAAHTVTLYARTLGLESCYIGLLEKAFLGYEPVRQRLYQMGLPEGNVVYSVLIMGYPVYKFLRASDRKPVKVVWS